jgi:hypothetical protein
MDQDQFRETYRVVNELACPYEKSILTNNCDCSRAERFCIAEREGVRCTSGPAQAQCLALLAFLRARARFAVQSTDERSTVPHGKAMKLQVGGMRGLKAALDPDAPVPNTIDDVHGTLVAALDRFGGLDQLPLPPIVQQIAAYRGRRRSRRRT